MNLILFSPEEIAHPLPRTDPRARHILDVLRRAPGDRFDAGLIDGPRGKATLAAIGEDGLQLVFAWDAPPPPLPALVLIVGLPRPQTARDILRDATTLGATGIHFVTTERSDPNYASATLWHNGDWRRHCLIGAEQAFDTRVPHVTWDTALAAAIGTVPGGATRLALDNYEATEPLGAHLASRPVDAPIVLALGPERGWGPEDRQVLRDAGFALVHLGPRVLRLETAVVAAMAIIGDRRGRR